jgi:hypothetical protein
MLEYDMGCLNRRLSKHAENGVEVVRVGIAGERSTAVTDPGRRANGIARRPTPHPYSRIETGANWDTSRSSMVVNAQSTNASPLLKNSRSCAVVKFARRNFGDVRTAKYGSRSTNASHRGSASLENMNRLMIILDTVP